MEPLSKRQAKLDKIQKKSRSAKPEVSEPFNKEHNDNIITEKDSNVQIQFIDPTHQLKQAKQWWKNLDHTYFKPVKLKNLLHTRDLTSAQKLPNYPNEVSQLKGSYQSEQIYTNHPQLAQNTLIKVLFKSKDSLISNLVNFLCVNYVQNFNKRSAKNLKQQEFINDETLEFQITSYIQKPQINSNAKQFSEQEIQQILKSTNLQIDSSITNKTLISKIQRAQQIRKQKRQDEEINKQLQMWKQEAKQLDSENCFRWENIITAQKIQIQLQEKSLQTEISLIKQSLMHYTILRYMQHGTKDKTQQMLKQLLDNLKQLKPTKTRQITNKKFFETDCKICFCSFNYDSNQVLYCDMCNTSFHLACYGLQQVPQDKEYFCDRCIALKNQGSVNNNLKKITCQICCKPSFPIKNIDGHFYHMTCLILLNYITIKEQKIKLCENVNHSNIIKRVIESEIQCDPCIFCLGSSGAEMGMRFKCSVEGCQSSMHPICAYINGCRFSVRKSLCQKKLLVDILCNKHDYERDYIQQTYLRRYMCNFKNTSQKSLQQFKAEYQAEILPRQPKTKKNNQPISDLIIDNKIIRKYISQKQQKKTQKNQDIQTTETRKFFQKLIKNL